jgi:hypothetical protein
MKRSASLLFIGLFFAAQTFALLHVAQFDFESHKHDGQACEIYLHEKKSGCADMPSGSALPEVALNGIQKFRFESFQLVFEIHESASPRGPPAFLLY